MSKPLAASCFRPAISELFDEFMDGSASSVEKKRAARITCLFSFTPGF